MADLTEYGDEMTTDEERKAIASLERLAKKWPRSLTLQSMSGSLHVMHTDDCMLPIERGGGCDPDKVIVHIDGIPNDGGDW